MKPDRQRTPPLRATPPLVARRLEFSRDETPSAATLAVLPAGQPRVPPRAWSERARDLEERLAKLGHPVEPVKEGLGDALLEVQRKSQRAVVIANTTVSQTAPGSYYNSLDSFVADVNDLCDKRPNLGKEDSAAFAEVLSRAAAQYDEHVRFCEFAKVTTEAAHPHRERLCALLKHLMGDDTLQAMPKNLRPCLQAAMKHLRFEKGLKALGVRPTPDELSRNAAGMRRLTEAWKVSDAKPQKHYDEASPLKNSGTGDLHEPAEVDVENLVATAIGETTGIVEVDEALVKFGDCIRPLAGLRSFSYFQTVDLCEAMNHLRRYQDECKRGNIPVAQSVQDLLAIVASHVDEAIRNDRLQYQGWSKDPSMAPKAFEAFNTLGAKVAAGYAQTWVGFLESTTKEKKKK